MEEVKKYKYHIVWILRIDENGAQLSTGKDYEAVDMIHALMEFAKEHPAVSPLYALKKD